MTAWMWKLERSQLPDLTETWIATLSMEIERCKSKSAFVFILFYFFKER
jgi:hypothetical protein